MPYIIHSDGDIKSMLECTGKASTNDFFKVIPNDFRLNEDGLDIALSISEQDVKSKVLSISKENKTYTNERNFMGAGVYTHYIPSAVNHLSSRAEFYTAYTPYQPEVSQGTLQAIFEFQTFMTRLTGMDLSNASMYDGATSLAEAVLMSYRFKKQKNKKVLIPNNLHPEYLKVLKSWLEPFNLVFEFIEGENQISVSDFINKAENALCVIVQSPNFFGFTEEEVSKITDYAKSKDIVSIFLNLDPTSLGLYKSPKEMGFDIAVLEIQSLGNPVAYGGPHAGVITSSDKFIRELPGRIVGQTVDIDGNRTFVLTMCTREQHIRREKATSNICSNQALVALRSSIYLSLLGGTGLKNLALTNYSNAKKLAKKLSLVGGLSVSFEYDFYNEFVLECIDSKFLDKLISTLKAKNINPGYKIASTKILVAVTESNTDSVIDEYYKYVSEIK